MVQIRRKDVAGYYVEGELVGEGCIEAEELAAIEFDSILICDETKKDFWFCERCGRQLQNYQTESPVETKC